MLPSTVASFIVAAFTLVATGSFIILVPIAVNRRVPGSAFMAVGLLMNLAVVGLNGGMPVSADAIRIAGAQGVVAIEDGANLPFGRRAGIDIDQAPLAPAIEGDGIGAAQRVVDRPQRV